jgi:hypothetical protein
MTISKNLKQAKKLDSIKTKIKLKHPNIPATLNWILYVGIDSTVAVSMVMPQNIEYNRQQWKRRTYVTW